MNTYYYKVSVKNDNVNTFYMFEFLTNFTYRLVYHPQMKHKVPGPWVHLTDEDSMISYIELYTYEVLTHDEYVLEML